MRQRKSLKFCLLRKDENGRSQTTGSTLRELPLCSEKKDTVEKEFLSFPDIAADTINTLLYHGKEVIDVVKLHVFEMRHLPKETRELFQSDMRIVADFLAEGESYCSERKIMHKAALMKMLKVLSGDQDTDDVDMWLKEQGIREEDEITVCELFDQYERKGRKEGIKEGIKEGRTEGMECGRARQLVADIESAMNFFNVTLEKACEGLGTTVGKYEEARKMF